jgi:hypothetical protein
MSETKQVGKVIDAYRQGERAKRPYSNPYCKTTKERDLHRAYRNGWNDCP